MGRSPCCDKANVKKGPWSPEEDAKLKAYIEEHGTVRNWIALPHKIGLKRCGKSCRLRWLNYLRPNIKHGGFTAEEDHIICSLYLNIGSRWSIIAAQLPGRTDNDIKNYWNTRLKKKLLGDGRRAPSHPCCLSSNLYLKQDSSSQAPSASAIERMQLLMRIQGLYNPFSSGFYSSSRNTSLCMDGDEMHGLLYDKSEEHQINHQLDCFKDMGDEMFEEFVTVYDQSPLMEKMEDLCISDSTRKSYIHGW
ncbi:hypothetical protein J5N97_003385 [Dioscorea zingiberensis]|uniref:Uncharacterized protein n=1 Tax=Dioscorea zingiberensis TaxID=325984 RepID=A0A9D5D5R6_9LILI|nr:hypothetical protein J5N97_003385 [Dioscorea zingiberensis]